MNHTFPPTETQDRFNLLDEPWIPVVTLNGREEHVSMRSALLESHTFRDLSGETPTMRFALMRILLAVVYRVLDREYADDPIELWEELWKGDSLPSTEFEKYFAAWSHRFDLADADAPFLQTPSLRTAKDEWKPISLIVADTEPDRPLFTMRSELDSLDLAAAARWLVHAYAYDYSGIKSGAVGDNRVKGGRGYPMGIGLAGWLGGTIITGATLRETLLLNFIPNASSEFTADVPAWERDVPTAAATNPGERGIPGPVELLTWPQRRIRLRVTDGRADGVLVTNGDDVDYTQIHDRELLSSWRFSEPQSAKAKIARYMPRALQPGHSLWRGLSTLIPSADSALPSPQAVSKWGIESLAIPARVVSWVGDLVGAGALSADLLLEISVVSMEYGTQNASFAGIVSDRLGLAAALTSVEEDGLLSTAQLAVKRTENAVRILVNLAQDLDRAAGGDGDSEHFSITIGEETYTVLDATFRAWLLKLRPGVDREAAMIAWTEHLRSVVRERSNRLIDAAPYSAWIGKAQSASGTVVSVGSATQRFDYRLRAELGRPPQPQTDTSDRVSLEEEVAP